MDSPSMSTTEFIQNDSFGDLVTSPRTPKSPKSPSIGSSNLVSQLKQSLEQAQNELNQQIFLNSELKIYKSKYEDLNNDYNTLAANYESLESEKKFSDIEITNLRKETEELSSQLFSEANNMVSQARKEAFNFKKMNDTLKNENNEKDNLIHILKSQLGELKTLLQDQSDTVNVTAETNNIEITYYPDENMTNDSLPEANKSDLKNMSSRNASNLSIGNKPGTVHPSNSYTVSNFVYAPTVQAIRYDIKTYYQFVEFGEKLYHEFKAGHHTSNTSKASYLEIKEHKFYKKLLNDDIEPALRLDEAPGVAWLSKKNLINSMLIGKVSIEPISSVNESYKTDIVLNSISEPSINSLKPVAPANEPPVAFEDPCSLCGETKNDTLDHTRLYVLKVIGTRTVKQKKDSKSDNQNTFSKFVSNNSSKDTVSVTQEYIANQYPLCSYCLHRVRSVCELFAFLRGIKAGIWKFDTKLNCQKNWIECIRIRTKVFYSRIGIIESSHNLVNNNSFTFNINQINGIDIDNNVDLKSHRNSGYFSNYGTRMSSPVMTNFSAFNASNTFSLDSESDITTLKNSGLFSNRNSLIGSFWGTTNSPSSSTATATATANTTTTTPTANSVPSVTPQKKRESNLLVYNESTSSFNSDKLEGKIDEVITSPIDDTGFSSLNLETKTTASPEKEKKQTVSGDSMQNTLLDPDTLTKDLLDPGSNHDLEATTSPASEKFVDADHELDSTSRK